MHLAWHCYKYFPYEQDLAIREVAALFGTSSIKMADAGIEIERACGELATSRLTYFASAQNGHNSRRTVQSQLEDAARNGKKRQATRYSVHGLHEYKGKFNPQVARALLNIFGVQEGQHVFDPFCGSGTTLVECAHLGAIGCGIDINPFAVYVAKAKLQALRTPVNELHKALNKLSQLSPIAHSPAESYIGDSRHSYLASWFDAPILSTIENVRISIEDIAGMLAPIFLTIASNLLRDYSQQDPKDLRIRRRKSPLPVKPFWSAFLDAAREFVGRLEAAQNVIGICGDGCLVSEMNIENLSVDIDNMKFDAAITSPPYAMALPYIDTQRLSLVWLGLLPPGNILDKESELIGSREIRGNSKRELYLQLTANEAKLPSEEENLCLDLLQALCEEDGFRRQAVPNLLYRYFAAMKRSFISVRSVMKDGGRYGLIVGHNHTTIGGIRRDIDTPSHLANLAQAEGWRVDELIPLQTYRRYGYHVNNAVAAETLLVLRAE